MMNTNTPEVPAIFDELTKLVEENRKLKEAAKADIKLFICGRKMLTKDDVSRLLTGNKRLLEENKKLKERVRQLNIINYDLADTIDNCEGDCSYELI